MRYFNPHHHAGGDIACASLDILLIDFNPHHHAGGDIACATLDILLIDFNPHHHAGGDTPYSHHLPYSGHFNPHHHAGGDGKSTQLFIPISVNFHKNLLLQPHATSTCTKSIQITPTIPDSPGANLPGFSWVLPIRTGVSEH